MVFETADDEDNGSIVPFVSARAKRGKKRRKSKRKRKPKYRDMVIRSVKSLREPKGCTYNAIAKFIEEKYHVRNDFVLKHVVNWLCQKRVLSKRGARVKLTGKSLKLGARVGGKGKKKSKRSKRRKAKKAKKAKKKKAKKSKKRKKKKRKRKKKKKKKKAKRSKKSRKSRRGKRRKGKRRRR